VIIGVTGGIASGKSEVCRVFADQGALVLDADEIGQEVVEDPDVLDRLVERFGRDILKPDGRLDRRGLGRRVFRNPLARAQLEAIVHPPLLLILRTRIEEALRADPSRPVVVDAALIVECNLEDWFDVLITVVAPEAEQIRRLVEQKGFDPEEAMDRIRSQLPSEQKTAVADYVIQNDDEREILIQRTRAIWEAVQARSDRLERD
jgi:dephospho-CoA kinase